MWENKSACIRWWPNYTRPIHLLCRLYGKSFPWKWLKGNDTLQREIDVNVKTWPSLSISQVITFGVYALRWQMASSLWFGKPNFPTKVVQVCLVRKHWRVYFQTKPIFNSMPENRTAEWRCQSVSHLRRNMKCPSLWPLWETSAYFIQLETHLLDLGFGVVLLFCFCYSFIASSSPLLFFPFPVLGLRKYNISEAWGGDRDPNQSGLKS